MHPPGPPHPLDTDLADDPPSAEVDAHVTDCRECRARQGRLRHAPPAALGLDLDRALPSVEFGFAVPAWSTAATGEPGVGEVWRTAGDERLLVLVLRGMVDGRVLVAPATFDVEAADDETLVADAAGIAVHPRLAIEVPRTTLVDRMGSLDLTGARAGPAVVGADDPRIEIRQVLADRLGSLEDQPPDPASRDGAPPRPLTHLRSALIGDLRSWRGPACGVRPLHDWGDVLLAHRAGWEPVATIDEVGIVLVVFDTPHGLADDADFDAARSVLTRFNATAVVALARAVSDTAEVFDSSSLNYGIDAPSGHHTPPRPLISGLAPFDAIAKFLDQTTGMKAAAATPSRGPVTRVDVDVILREAVEAAVADAVRQGPKFRIAPKRRGYESIAGAEEALAAALRHSFGAGFDAEELLGL